MKKRCLCLVLPILTLLLELLPYGAVCVFANPEGEPWRETFSYFDLTPFGYANFAPFLTALLTCVVLLLLAVYCLSGKLPLVQAARALLVVGCVLSLCPLLFGIRCFSVVGLLITLSLVGALVVVQQHIRGVQP